MRHRHFNDRHVLPLVAVFSMVAASAAAAQEGATPAAAAAATSWPDPVTAPAEILSIARIQKSLLLDGVNSRDRAVVVGDRGHILVSESRSEWRQVPVPTRVMLTAVDSVDNSVWAVGHDQVIVYSADGGLTWTLQNHKSNSDGPLLDVMFLDAARGFAVGAYGQFLSTSDSGANWTAQVISDRAAGASADTASADTDAVDDASFVDEDSGLASTEMGEDEGDPHLNAIVRNSMGMLIVGEAGAVYRSTDGGATWARSDLPYEGSMFGAIALDDDNVVAFGLRGNAFVTSDLGLTWRALQTGTEASLLGGAAVPGGRAVIVGASGSVLLLPAGAGQALGYSFPDGGVMSGVLPLSETEFLTIGENGLAPYQPN